MSNLSIKNLSIHFGGVQALTNVNIEVPPKSFVGLMGPNGAGKTTLLNCVSRLYNPDEGQIYFDGHDILKLRGDELTRLGIARTFQDLNFFSQIENTLVIDYMKLGQFDPGQNSFIKSGLQLKSSIELERQITKNSRRILDFFRQLRDHLEDPQEERNFPLLYGREGFPDLLDFEYHPIGSLSFAWRRRLDLARALACSPRLLLLDEPAQGLAPSEIENLGKTLKIVQAEFGVSALIVEHNVDTLMKISDQIAVLDHGKIIANGPPEEIRINKEVIEIYLGHKSEKVLSEGSITATESIFVSPRATDSVPLVEVKNLDLFYGTAQALFSVSLKFFPKQITSILGTNGSGKSTLLKAISGYEKPIFGEILFNGEALPLGWPEIINERGIQYVPQGHLIFPELTVMENLRIGAYALEKKGGKLSQGLDKIYSYFVDLRDLRSLQAANLSGGQQQMLAMAQALIGDPQLLLLDEPSLGLSPALVENLFNIIQRISKDEKCSIVLVEQNTKKALEISDYIFMMSSGVLIGEGTSKQFKENDSLIKELLGFH